MNNDLMKNLNPEQLKAVRHDQGPLLIVAGAGTGKTTVITQRIAYLIEQGRAKPEEILALTFTDKAAGEMEERVDRLLPMGYLDLWISTFHGFGERILGAHGLDIGLSTEPRLLNEFEQYALVKENLDRFDLDYYRPLGNPTKFIQHLIRHFSRLKDEDISPSAYLEYAQELRQNLDSMLSGAEKSLKHRASSTQKEKNNKFQISNFTDDKGEVNKEIAQQEINRINEAASAYHVYQQLLLDNNALDFGDLINYTLRLFRERPAILEKYRQQFKYILLDEFQDTNWAQYELIKLLAAPQNNLVVVGDDDQSVYKFRGASLSNILQFKEDFPGSREVFLTRNYRNTQNILDLSYEFIQQNNPNRLEYRLNDSRIANKDTGENRRSKIENSKKLSKKLIAESQDEGLIEVIEGRDTGEEIRLAVERIADLKIRSKGKSELNWSDFAILVRANEAAKQVCQTLEAAGLPYLYLASRGLYTKPVIMDSIAFLKLLDNYHEGSAMYRVLKLPESGFSDKEIIDLAFIARKKAWSLYTAVKEANAKLGEATAGKCRHLISLIEQHTAMARDKSALEVWLSFLTESGMLKRLSALDEAKSREQIGYLNQFKKRIEKFLAVSGDKSVKAFLYELDLEIDAGEQGAISPDAEAGPDTIKVMTVHAAKGLEFKYVFLTNLVDRRFPTTERREPIQIPEALVKEILPEGDIHLEEERRLFYVALTRAERGVFLSWARDYGGSRPKKPSRFLAECGLAGDKPANGPEKAEAAAGLKPPGREFGVPEGVPYYPPTYFSFSKLTAFINCPYQYRFNYILQVPTKNKHYFSFGKTMHAALQKLFQMVQSRAGYDQASLFAAQDKAGTKDRSAVKIEWDEAKKLYQESWIDEWYMSQRQKKEYKEKGEKIMKEFLKRHNRAWPDTIHLEKGFKNKIQGESGYYTIGGTIDRVDQAGDKLRIVDYKTGAPKDKLGFDDKFQLLIYQLAARDIFRSEVESLAFYYLENQNQVEFLGSEDELEKTRDKILSTINEIHQGVFKPKPSKLCKYCDFFEICEHRQN